jgi:hypothetical protein
MKTLVIYFDESKKNFQKITPFGQGPEFDDRKRFDGNWHKLATHLGGNRIVSTDVY